MSSDPSLSRKDKKAIRDVERHKKHRKQKPAANEEDTNADAQILDEHRAETTAGVTDGADTKTELQQRQKKRKRQEPSENADPAASATPEKPKRLKNSDDDAAKAAEGDAQDSKPTKSRFIVFIGNLPYATTDSSLQAHFKKLEPFTLRHRTDPKTKKSKGFAFLEFENYDKMKTCLKLYHHSLFDPEDKENGGSGKGNGKGARKINVELTAGGGGKTEGRKEKIKAKNIRLEEQRKRRAEAERKEKVRKERKEKGEGKDLSDLKPKLSAEEPAQEESHGRMHPSRLARLNA